MLIVQKKVHFAPVENLILKTKEIFFISIFIVFIHQLVDCVLHLTGNILAVLQRQLKVEIEVASFFPFLYIFFIAHTQNMLFQ